MSRLGIGVIGCGGLAMSLAKHLNTIENVELVVGADPSAEQRAKFKTGFDIPVYSHHRRVLSHPDVEAVLVVTPNNTHARISIEALEAGKHVFCEKPMAMNVAQCDRMIAAAERNGLRLMVGQVLRLFPMFVKVKEIIDSGVLGEPFGMFIARSGFGGGFLGTWRQYKHRAGGLLLEINAHELDYMRCIMGEIESVFAQMGHFLDNDLEYEDLAFVELKFRNGGIGMLYSSLACAIGEYRGVIQCKEGTMTHSGFNGGITYARFRSEATTLTADDCQGEDPYRHELRSFVESILNGTPMVFDGRDGRAAVEIAEAAYLSAKRGRPVFLSR